MKPGYGTGANLGNEQVKRAEEAGLTDQEQQFVSGIMVAVTLNIRQIVDLDSPRAAHVLLTNIEELCATLRHLVPPEHAS